MLFLGQLGFFGPNLCFNFFFFCYYPKAIVIILQAAGQSDRIEHILLDFMGQFTIFLEGEGQDCIFWGQIENFLCVHTY